MINFLFYRMFTSGPHYLLSILSLSPSGDLSQFLFYVSIPTCRKKWASITLVVYTLTQLFLNCKSIYRNWANFLGPSSRNKTQLTATVALSGSYSIVLALSQARFYCNR